MDIDREMERLQREVREKSAREQAEREADAKAADAEAKKAAEVVRDAVRGDAEEDDEDDVAGSTSDASIGVKVLAVIGLLVVLFVVWRMIVAPLIGLAITVGMIALVVWVILKLAGFGAKT